MYKTKKKGGAMTQAATPIQDPTVLGSKMPSQSRALSQSRAPPQSRALSQSRAPPQSGALSQSRAPPQNQQLIDIDGEKIKIIKTEKKPCKYSPTLCKLKQLI